MKPTLQEEIARTVEVLRKGGSILYPTDTIWGLGCDATNTRAIKRLQKIKQRSDNKHFIILLDGTDRLQEYVKLIPEAAWDLYQQIQTPLTIVFPDARNLSKLVVGKDRTVGIRIPRDDFALELVRQFGKPVISTSANLSGDPSPMFFRDINPVLLQEVDYVVDFHRDRIQETKPSTIIRLHENGEFEVIRR
ncbi:MAG: threonylcarbamoyl-AMP synthase [Lentimicrobiaceae bacterium]|nr:threonylcarbamoyl-AMP synthase [Lentimicrobiaceae bacterium]